MKFFQKTFLIWLILIGALGANFVYAGIGPLRADESIVPCGTSKNPEECNLCHLWELGDNIIRFLTFNLALPVAAFLFVIVGVMLLVSGGNEQRVALAKSIFTNTVIGLVIIFTSWLLVDTFLKTIASNFESVVGAWNQFPGCK
jgi:hypothetical protein